MLLVVGWDGASFEVLEPLLAEGRLPVLSKFLSRAARRPLRSTVPPVTFPAWTTFLTGCEPATHGLTDFTLRDGYSVRFVNASYRRVPTLWKRMSDAGLRVGSYAVPATYPPEPLDGIVVPGFDTPLGASGSCRTEPAGVGRQIIERHGSLAVGGPSQLRIGPGWHRDALARMLADIETRTRIVCELLEAEAFDCFMVHFGESDTVSHHFWHHADVRSPRFDPEGIPTAVADVYQALDRALGRLLKTVGTGAAVMLVSDHGSGGTSDRVIFWNRWLADRGYLGFHSRSPLGRVQKSVRRAAMALLPHTLAASLFRRAGRAADWAESTARFSGIDWSRTVAFSEELNYQPAIWINRVGREPRGLVSDAQYAGLIARLKEDLSGFVDPFDGKAVVRRVLERADVASGPFAARLPDLLLELRCPDGYSYAAASSRNGRETKPLRRLRAEEATGAKGTSMAGCHRPLGICAVAGHGVRPGRYPQGSLAEAGATVAGLVGVDVGDAIDASPWQEIFEEPPVLCREAPHEERQLEPVALTAEEQRELADKLRSLGYLE